MKPSNNTHLKLFATIVQELSLARDLSRVMTIVRTAARKLTGADGATFILREGDNCYYSDEDAISPLWKGNRFPMKSCISGWAMLNKTPALIEDIYKDDRIPHDAYRPTFVKSLAMVPIRSLEPIGAIGNYWATYRAPTTDEVNLLQSLADVTAVTIENLNVYNELEQRVKDRTADLEMINKELEAFSYSVSHDLRAPLRSILGYSEALQEENSAQLDEGGKRFLFNIRNNAKKMNVLIDDLLIFSRLARKPLNKTIVSSNELVANVIEDLPSESRPALEIADLHPVLADPGLIRQVWINLISNAIKYSSKKQAPKVSVGSYKSDREVVFVVRDNGAGFDMKYADKLFGAFQRLHSSEDFPGNGVGLALVQRIVARHGGRIWAEGKVDLGATFYFAIPE